MSGLALSDYRRLVIKVGSTLLVDDNGQLNRVWLDELAADVASLARNGHEILIVSSGAVAIGSSVLGINKKRARLEELQAAAAAGQVQLVHAYQDAFRAHNIVAAQILLTPDDTEDAGPGDEIDTSGGTGSVAEIDTDGLDDSNGADVLAGRGGNGGNVQISGTGRVQVGIPNGCFDDSESAAGKEGFCMQRYHEGSLTVLYVILCCVVDRDRKPTVF